MPSARCGWAYVVRLFDLAYGLQPLSSVTSFFSDPLNVSLEAVEATVVQINRLALQVVILTASVALPGLAMADSPTDWVQGTVVEVTRTLAVRDSGAGMTPQQIREVSRVFGKRFDFHGMARLALDQHWKELSNRERTEFVHLFRNLLERSQLWELSAHADSEQRYVSERMEGDQAVVRSLVQVDDGEVPVDYFLLLHNGSWKICDLSIDGVRLSHMYRAEFNKVISKGSYKELVRKMSAKLEEVGAEPSSRK